MVNAAEVIAKCLESDYNRTFHDTAVCILADLKQAGYAAVEVPKGKPFNGQMSWRTIVQGEPEDIYIRYEDEPEVVISGYMALSVDEADDLARALLAATSAVAAERSAS